MLKGRNDFLQQKLNNLKSQVRANKQNTMKQRSYTPNISHSKNQFTFSQFQQPYQNNINQQDNSQYNFYQNTNNIWQQNNQPRVVYAKNGITSLHLNNKPKNQNFQLPLKNLQKKKIERVSQVRQQRPQHHVSNQYKRQFARSVDFQTSRNQKNQNKFGNIKEYSRRSDLSPDRQLQAQNQLSQKYELMVDQNKRLQNDIKNLVDRGQRGHEDLKYTDLEFLKELEYQENQFEFAKNKFADLQEKLTQTQYQIQRENNRQQEFQKLVPEYKLENKLLKKEITKYVEIASKDILDMENNLNKLGRLKQMEKENFQMEKDKRKNEQEFQEENYNAMYKQKKIQKDEQIDKINYDKSKVQSEIKKIQDQLKNFNYDANQQIKETMMKVMDENEAKQQLQYDNYIQQIQAEDEQCEIIRNINFQMNQEIEHNSKKNNKNQINYKNKKIYLTEEIENLQYLLERMHLEFNNQESKQESDLIYIEELKQELEELEKKIEIQQYQKEQEYQIDELKMQVREFEDIEQDLAQQILNKKQQIKEDQFKMQQIMKDQFDKIKDTLSDQLITVHLPFNQNALQQQLQNVQQL